MRERKKFIKIIIYRSTLCECAYSPFLVLMKFSQLKKKFCEKENMKYDFNVSESRAARILILIAFCLLFLIYFHLQWVECWLRFFFHLLFYIFFRTSLGSASESHASKPRHSSTNNTLFSLQNMTIYFHHHLHRFEAVCCAVVCGCNAAFQWD